MSVEWYILTYHDVCGLFQIFPGLQHFNSSTIAEIRYTPLHTTDQYHATGQQPDSMQFNCSSPGYILSRGSSFHSLVYILDVTFSNYRYSAMSKFTRGNGYNTAKLLRKFVVAYKNLAE